MLRQALAESQAWTPMPSPWTLPTGLASLAALGRPLSRSTSWLAASDRASPMASGAMPSARAAATASAACSGVEPKMVWLILSTQASSAVFVPSGLAGELVLVQQLRQHDAGGRARPGVVAAPAHVVLDAVMHRLAQQHAGVFHADDAGQGPGAVRQHDAVDLQFLLNGGEKLVEGVDRFAVAGEGDEGAVGGGDVLVVHGVAQGVGAGLVGGQVGRLDGTERVGPVGAAVALEAAGVAERGL